MKNRATMPQRAAQAAPSYCPVSDGVTLQRRPGAPACFLWYDRHIEKNGGSTLRNVLKRLEEHGECAYWGYHLEKESWTPVMATLRRPSRVPPRLCVEAHMGAILAIDHALESLNRTATAMRERGCAVLRTLRVREPLSHYKSFYLWQVSREERVPKRREQLGEQFVRWVNATPNLQASTFRHPGAVQQAVKAPEKRGKEDPSEAFISASDSREWRPRLGAALAHFDLVSPTEEFDAAFLLAAETLGLQHVSFHRVEPTCQKGYLERYDLEDPSQCAQLEQNVRHCEGWARPACAPEWQAECDAAVRRVAPLDAWLHRTATRRFRATMEAVDGGFAARLAAFQAKRFGVWKGGPPTRPKCKFVRLTSEQWSSYRPLDFERHLCTPGPQAAVKAVWRNSQMLGRAAIVPNNATCRANPTSPECSVPLEHGRRDKAPLRYLRS